MLRSNVVFVIRAHHNASVYTLNDTKSFSGFLALENVFLDGNVCAEGICFFFLMSSRRESPCVLAAKGMHMRSMQICIRSVHVCIAAIRPPYSEYRRKGALWRIAAEA